MHSKQDLIKEEMLTVWMRQELIICKTGIICLYLKKLWLMKRTMWTRALLIWMQWERQVSINHLASHLKVISDLRCSRHLLALIKIHISQINHLHPFMKKEEWIPIMKIMLQLTFQLKFRINYTLETINCPQLIKMF